ncbi:MAG: bi-domain-containing oxidoreductase [Phycisphaerae bacterium]
MRQIVQNYKTGALFIEQVPAPVCRPGCLLVRTAYSLVSTGTERMKVAQARMNLLAKARARPEKVKQVLENIRQVGLAETANKVRERLDALTPLGYSLAGVVEEVGSGVDAFAVGDHVACAGEGIACHAEFVSVPRNLCVAVPAGADLKDAAFATVGAIAINGVRQAGVSLGDTVLVVGLGLVGLLGVQILKAAGCKVIGVDVDPRKVELALACGADAAMVRADAALKDTILETTGGVGPDAAYIAASTRSADPMKLAGEVLRDRGRVVIVGMVPVEADWQTYYGKELSVCMSRSYGPGRYDADYERRGIDYPIGYVRWTEGRNLEEFLRLLDIGAVSPSRLSPSVFAFDQAAEAYRELHESPGRHAVGILFEYGAGAALGRTIATSAARTNGRFGVSAKSASEPSARRSRPSGNGRPGVGLPVGIGMIGAGHFATGTLIPSLKKVPQARLRIICSSGGLSARSAARRHGFEFCSSDVDAVLSDGEVDAVVIATRHDSHARLAAQALRAGKHVFVEKPLALNAEQLAELVAAKTESGRVLMPGFNRRFSPLSAAVREFFDHRAGPIEVVCRVNAGGLAADSWYHDPDEGGWRIVSEGCHFVDLIQFLCGSRPVRAFATMIGGEIDGRQNDNCSVLLNMADGSVGTLIYVANGDTTVGKERVEVFGQGRTAVIDNWKVARLFADGRARKVRLRGSGKGHVEELRAFVDAIQTGCASPLPFDDAVNCTATTFAIQSSLRSGLPEPCGFAPAGIEDAASGKGADA